LSGRGLCDELITRPEESYRLCCVVVCDLETSRMGAPYIYDISRLRVNTRKFLEPCKLFVSPSQKAADTEHAVHCLIIAGNRLTGVALEDTSMEQRGQIFAAMSAHA